MHFNLPEGVIIEALAQTLLFMIVLNISLPTKGIILIKHIVSNFLRYKEWH